MIARVNKNRWGGRWVTIPQPSAPQADALPIELQPPFLPYDAHKIFIPRITPISNAEFLP